MEWELTIRNLPANKSLQATRDGRFPRRQGYAGQASSASRACIAPWGHAPLRGSRHLVPRA